MYVLYACMKRSLRSPHAEHTSEHVKSFSNGLQSVAALVMESVLSVREGNKSGKTESEGVSQRVRVGEEIYQNSHQRFPQNVGQHKTGLILNLFPDI